MTKEEYKLSQLNRIYESMFAVEHALNRGKQFYLNGNKAAGKDFKDSLRNWIDRLTQAYEEICAESRTPLRNKIYHVMYLDDDQQRVIAGGSTQSPMTVYDLRDRENDTKLVIVRQELLDLYDKVAEHYSVEGRKVTVTGGFILHTRKNRSMSGSHMSKHNRGSAIDFTVQGVDSETAAKTVRDIAVKNGWRFKVVYYRGYVHVHVLTSPIGLFLSAGNRSSYSINCGEYDVHNTVLAKRYPAEYSTDS